MIYSLSRQYKDTEISHTHDSTFPNWKDKAVILPNLLTPDDWFLEKVGEFSVLLNAESTSRVQSFPQSLIPVLSAMRAGVIPRYPVTHAHSRYPNCPGGKDIIFIPGHCSLFL